MPRERATNARLDMDKIAKALGAVRCGRVTAGSGYVGAMQLVADIAARFRVHSSPGGLRPKNRSRKSKMRIREHGRPAD
jgi:hypothetical protein